MKRAPLTMLAVAAGLLLAAGAVQATVIKQLTLAEVEDLSKTVLVGTVMEQRVVEDDMPVTEVTFEDLQVLKGEVVRSTVTYRFAGGMLGETGLRVVGVPEFEVGERYVLFVYSGFDPYCPLTGWWQGRYRVVRDEADGGSFTIATSDGAPVYGFEKGCPILRPIDGVRPLTLEAFLDLVKDLVDGVERDSARGEPGDGAEPKLAFTNTTPTFGKWSTPSCTFFHDPNTMTGSLLTEFQAAMAVWSSIQGSAFTYVHGGAASGTPVYSNGVTEVMLENLGMQGYGVTKIPMGVTVITEADISLNSIFTWNTGSTSNGNPHLRTVATHELGHALGLQDWDGATVPSIMDRNTDPSVIRSIGQADRDAVVGLYPAGGPGPGPVTGPDLLLESVTWTPADAVPGDLVTIRYTMRNIGTDPSGAFYADAFLTGSPHPQLTDRWLGRSATTNNLGASESGENRIENVRLPTGLAPGRWRVAVWLDRDGAVADTDPLNNSDSSTTTIDVSRPALDIVPGTTVTGQLGPLGRDTFRIFLHAGMRLRVRGTVSTGSHALELRHPDTGNLLQTTGAAKKSRLKWKATADGAHTLHLDSGFAGVLDYTLVTGAKQRTRKDRIAVGGETRIPLDLYAGWTVRLKLKAKDGLVPTFAIEGAEVDVRANKKGTKLRIGPFTAPAGDAPVLVLGPGEGSPGSVLLVLKEKPPKDGLFISR